MSVPETNPSSTDQSERDLLTARIIAAVIEVHRHLGPGLLESVDEDCLCHELRLRGINFQRQVPLPLTYKGLSLDPTYRIDRPVEDQVVLELKAVDQMLPVFRAQVLSYLRLSGKRVGLLINFHVPQVTRGVERLVL